MKLDRPFHAFTLAEYRRIIPRYRQYADFNPLGLYRSIVENPHLDDAGRVEIWLLANVYFRKFLDGLLVKDIQTHGKRAGEK